MHIHTSCEEKRGEKVGRGKGKKGREKTSAPGHLKKGGLSRSCKDLAEGEEE